MPRKIDPQDDHGNETATDCPSRSGVMRHLLDALQSLQRAEAGYDRLADLKMRTIEDRGSS